MSRRKGKVAEREVEAELKASGLDYVRRQDGQAQLCDFDAEGVRLEVKRRETLALDAWSREVEAKTPGHLTPAVCYRRNGEPWRVALPLDDLLDLLRVTSS